MPKGFEIYRNKKYSHDIEKLTIYIYPFMQRHHPQALDYSYREEIKITWMTCIHPGKSSYLRSWYGYTINIETKNSKILKVAAQLTQYFQDNSSKSPEEIIVLLLKKRYVEVRRHNGLDLFMPVKSWKKGCVYRAEGLTRVIAKDREEAQKICKKMATVNKFCISELNSWKKNGMLLTNVGHQSEEFVATSLKILR